MRKFTFFFKSLLAACLLMGGANAWADAYKQVLYSENFEKAGLTPADVNWTGHANSNLAISDNASYSTYGKFISGWPSGSGNRSMGGTLSFTPSGYTTSSVTDLGYVIEFDALLKGGQEKSKSQSEFIVTYEKTLSSTGNTYFTEENVGGYLFALSQKTNSTGGFEKTWYINDLGNATDKTATLEYNIFYHYKLVVTKTSVSYTISATGKSDITGSKTINLQTVPVAKQIYMLLGRNSSWFLFDNVEIYDYKPYSDLYKDAKAPYDTKVASLDAAGQAYWTANVTSAASVTDEASYNTAVAALPTTYVAAVKAQTTAGSNMTDAVENANCETLSDWGAVTAWSSTSDQFHGNSHSTDVAQISTPFAESWVYTGSDPAAVLADQTISHTAISGLSAGVYRVTGFIRAASEGSHASETPTGFSLYANSETSSTTEGISSAAGLVYGTYSVEVTLDGTEDLTFGIEVKDANFNWVAFKNFTLTYLGAEKKSYTINAVAGETVIKELATGSEWPSDTYGAYVPKVILYDSKYYVLDDPNLSNYYASYTMGATDVVKEINYTLDESIVAYAEAGTNITQSTSNNASYSSGNYGHVNGGESFSLGTLGAGTYEFAAYYVSNSNRGLYLRNGNIADKSANTIVSQTLSSAGMVYANFQLTSSTPILFTGYTNNLGKYNQSAEFDFIYIRKTGEVLSSSADLEGYKTFYNATTNYEADENTTIYKAAAPSDGKVVLTDVGGNKIIKAGEAVILKTTNTTNYTLVLTATETASTGDFDGNALQVAAGTESNKYVLGYTSANGFGFYYYTALLPAGYIFLDGAAPNPGVKLFSVVADGTATGVETPEVAEVEEEEILYNTAGVRVGKDYKGIVINQKGEKRLQK